MVMGENCEFCGAVPAKDSFAAGCGQNIDSVRLIRLRKSGASGRREFISARSKLPLDGFDPYVNCSKRSITTMPLAGKFFLFCFLLVEAILEGRGA